jgi:hypothetical protein
VSKFWYRIYPVIDKPHAHDNQPPSNNQEGHGPFDSESDESHVTGKLEDGVTGEEKQETDGVSGSNRQPKFFPHTGNLSLSDVDTIND